MHDTTKCAYWTIYGGLRSRRRDRWNCKFNDVSGAQSYLVYTDLKQNKTGSYYITTHCTMTVGVHFT